MSPKLKYKQTYLPYPAGIDPNLLRVGTLVVDIFNPFESRETGQFGFRQDLSREKYNAYIKGIPGYSEHEESNRSLHFSASREWGISAGLVDIAHGGVNSEKDLKVTIKGGLARRIEMQKPVQFLKECVLRQGGVMKYIQSIATPAWYAWFYTWFRPKREQSSVKIPKIWICTGVQLISSAQVHSDTSASSGQSAGASVDAGLVAGGIPTGQSVAKFEGHHEQGEHTDTDYRVKDYQVWAAKWFALDIKYVRPDDSTAASADWRVELGEVEDQGVGGVREDAKEISPTDADADDGRRVAVVDGLEFLDSAPLSDAELAQDPVFDIDEAPYSKALEGTDTDAFEKYRHYVECLE